MIVGRLGRNPTAGPVSVLSVRRTIRSRLQSLRGAGPTAPPRRVSGDWPRLSCRAGWPGVFPCAPGATNPRRTARCSDYRGVEIIISAILHRAVRDGRSVTDLGIDFDTTVPQPTEEHQP